MDQRFSPKKDSTFGSLFLITVLIPWVIASFHPHPCLIAGAMLVSALMIWVWFGTSYRINSEFVFYRNGPCRGKIPISKIKEIKRNSRSWSGIRPVLSTVCLRIRYNSYDMVWIAPEDEEKFIQAICELNPTIAVRD